MGKVAQTKLVDLIYRNQCKLLYLPTLTGSKFFMLVLPMVGKSEVGTCRLL